MWTLRIIGLGIEPLAASGAFDDCGHREHLGYPQGCEGEKAESSPSMGGRIPLIPFPLTAGIQGYLTRLKFVHWRLNWRGIIIELEKKKGECRYHLCDLTGDVLKCPFCGEFFCDTHVRPKPPGMPQFKSTNPKAQLFMEEYHKLDGHPCPPFSDIFKKKLEDLEFQYQIQLDYLCAHPNKNAIKKNKRKKTKKKKNLRASLRKYY